MRGINQDTHATATVEFLNCSAQHIPTHECAQDQATRNGENGSYGAAIHARTPTKHRDRFGVVAAGVSVVCAVVALAFFNSGERVRPGSKPGKFWLQELRQDGNLAEKVVKGPKHAGDDGTVSNPFAAAYTHPLSNTNERESVSTWNKWENRIDRMFSASRHLGDLSSDSGYDSILKLPEEGIVQGANLPQRPYLRFRKYEEEPDKTHTIGPEDKMVPAAEYLDEPHIGGWDAQTYEGAAYYLAHLHGNLDYKSFWDTADIINAALRDKVVKQDVYEKEDGYGNQGRQWGGVIVDWTTLNHQTKSEKGEAVEDNAPHFAHLANGAVKLTLPKGGSLPYRAEVPTTVFRPCKGHPNKGCQFEPPMSIPSQAPSDLPARSKKQQDALFAALGDHRPAIFVDQEDQRFNKELFGLAAKFEGDTNAPINLEDVAALEKLALRTAGSKWNEEKMNTNVFKYVADYYEVAPDAKAKIDEILAEGERLRAEAKDGEEGGGDDADGKQDGEDNGESSSADESAGEDVAAAAGGSDNASADDASKPAA